MNQVATTPAPTEQQIQMKNFSLEVAKLKPGMMSVLPKGMTSERIQRLALSVVQRTPELLQCTKDSMMLAIMQCAQLGMEPDGLLGQAYILPYKQTAQLIMGYKGLIRLALNSGRYNRIDATEIYEKDDLTISWAAAEPVILNQYFGDDPGKITGYLAIATEKGGGFNFKFMTAKQMEKFDKKANVWKSNPVEMGKKTVLRRLLKYMDSNVERVLATEDLIESGKNFSINEYGDIIEGAAEAKTSGLIDITEEKKESAADSMIAEIKKITKPHGVDNFVKSQGQNLLAIQQNDPEAYKGVMEAATARKAELATSTSDFPGDNI